MARFSLAVALIIVLTVAPVHAKALLTFTQCKQVARMIESELVGSYVDDITISRSAECSSDIDFTYKYEIVDMSISKEDFLESNPSLLGGLMQTWCGSDVGEDMKIFFSSVRSLTYHYTRSDGVYLGSVSLSEKDCASF